MPWEQRGCRVKRRTRDSNTADSVAMHIGAVSFGSIGEGKRSGSLWWSPLSSARQLEARSFSSNCSLRATFSSEMLQLYVSGHGLFKLHTGLPERGACSPR